MEGNLFHYSSQSYNSSGNDFIAKFQWFWLDQEFNELRGGEEGKEGLRVYGFVRKIEGMMMEVGFGCLFGRIRGVRITN